jgi:hypothetical protein
VTGEQAARPATGASASAAANMAAATRTIRDGARPGRLASAHALSKLLTSIPLRRLIVNRCEIASSRFVVSPRRF